MKVNKKYKLESESDKPNMVYAEYIDRIMVSDDGLVFMDVHNEIEDSEVKENVILFNAYELVASIAFEYPNLFSKCLLDVKDTVLAKDKNDRMKENESNR